MEVSDRALKNAAAERTPIPIGSYISLYSINVLEQPRRTFEEIPTLAQNIADKRTLFPPIVAQLDREQAQAYIEMVNGVWDTTHDISELTTTLDGEDKVFYILIDGERRLRANKYLAEV